MILIVLLAVGAICGADKLDRTYLPPPGSKFSGGSSGDILPPKELTPSRGSQTYQPGFDRFQPRPGVTDSGFPSTQAPGFGFSSQLPQGQGFTDETLGAQRPHGLTNQVGQSYPHLPGVTSQAEVTGQPGFSHASASTEFQNGFPTMTTSYAFTQSTTYSPMQDECYGQNCNFEESSSESAYDDSEIGSQDTGSQPGSQFAPGSVQQLNNYRDRPSKVAQGQRPGYSAQSPIANVGYQQNNQRPNQQVSSPTQELNNHIQGGISTDQITSFPPRQQGSITQVTPGQIQGPSGPGSQNRFQSQQPDYYQQTTVAPGSDLYSSTYGPSQSNVPHVQYSDNVAGSSTPIPVTSSFAAISSFPDSGFPSSSPVSTISDGSLEGVYPSPAPVSYQGRLPNGTLVGAPSYRPQAESDRSALILNYENKITPEGDFAYSYDTSNGIHADENGTAIDGVKAQGGYSYTGDDGKVYSIVYTADENGYLPRGDHLPTPPPIPEAILKVIEETSRAEAAGIMDDGLYDEDKYGYKKYDGGMRHLMRQLKIKQTDKMRRPKPDFVDEQNQINSEEKIYSDEESDNSPTDDNDESLTEDRYDDRLSSKDKGIGDNSLTGQRRPQSKISNDRYENRRPSSTKLRPQGQRRRPTGSLSITQKPGQSISGANEDTYNEDNQQLEDIDDDRYYDEESGKPLNIGATGHGKQRPLDKTGGPYKHRPMITSGKITPQRIPSGGIDSTSDEDGEFTSENQEYYGDNQPSPASEKFGATYSNRGRMPTDKKHSPTEQQHPGNEGTYTKYDSRIPSNRDKTDQIGQRRPNVKYEDNSGTKIDRRPSTGYKHKPYPSTIKPTEEEVEEYSENIPSTSDDYEHLEEDFINDNQEGPKNDIPSTIDAINASYNLRGKPGFKSSVSRPGSIKQTNRPAGASVTDNRVHASTSRPAYSSPDNDQGYQYITPSRKFDHEGKYIDHRQKINGTRAPSSTTRPSKTKYGSKGTRIDTNADEIDVAEKDYQKPQSAGRPRPGSLNKQYTTVRPIQDRGDDYTSTAKILTDNRFNKGTQPQSSTVSQYPSYTERISATRKPNERQQRPGQRLPIHQGANRDQTQAYYSTPGSTSTALYDDEETSYSTQSTFSRDQDYPQSTRDQDYNRYDSAVTYIPSIDSTQSTLSPTYGSDSNIVQSTDDISIGRPTVRPTYKVTVGRTDDTYKSSHNRPGTTLAPVTGYSRLPTEDKRIKSLPQYDQRRPDGSRVTVKPSVNYPTTEFPGITNIEDSVEFSPKYDQNRPGLSGVTSSDTVYGTTEIPGVTDAKSSGQFHEQYEQRRPGGSRVTSSPTVQYPGTELPGSTNVEISEKFRPHYNNRRPDGTRVTSTSGSAYPTTSLPGATNAESFGQYRPQVKPSGSRVTSKASYSTTELPGSSLDISGQRRPQYDQRRPASRVSTTASGYPTTLSPAVTETSDDFSGVQGIPETDAFGRPIATQDRVKGEDFSGPKQPQRFDPETGYHY